jgi:Transmembrane protein 43
LLRLGAFLLLFIGIGLLFMPIIDLVSMIPLVGTLLSIGLSIACWIFALVLAIVLFCLTVGLAWLYYRPIFGVCMLVVVAAGIALIVLI